MIVQIYFFLYLIINNSGDTNAAGLGQSLQARSHINAVSINFLSLLDHITEVDADAVFHLTAVGNFGISLGQLLLYLHCTSNSVHHTFKFRKQVVTRRINHAALILRYNSGNHLLVVL